MPRPNRTTAGDPRFVLWAIAGFLIVSIWLIYGQTLDYGLLDYDDRGFVTDNPHVTAGLTAQGIRWAWTRGPYGEWYPLSTMSHMLDCQLFGLNGWGHHLANVLYHAGASLALLLVWRRMSGELLPSAFVATAFAVHPQHVESVAWIAERRDVLSGLCLMLTLGAYLGYVRRGRSGRRYLLVAALFALGLLSKPMLVTVPPLLLLLDFWPLARIGSAEDTPEWSEAVQRPGAWRLVLEKLPLAALAAADCVMTLRTHFAAQSAPLGWSGRIGNAAVSCVTYLVEFLFPVGLAAHYPLTPGGPPAWKAAGAVVVLLALSAGAIVWRRRCPYVFVGWFWFLGMLTPVLGLVQVADHAMADRYMYLPGIGLYIALAWGATRLAARVPQGRWLLVAGTGTLIALWIAAAIWQTTFWYDDETLWRHALASTSENCLAEVGLGVALARQDRDEEAINQYRKALAINPESVQANLYLGSALGRSGQFDEAMRRLRRAIQLDPGNAQAYLSLGRLLAFQRRFDEAVAAFEHAISLQPDKCAPRNDLGSALFLQGKIDEAIVEYQAAVAIDPIFALGHVNLADALAARGQTGEAEHHYRRALELEPDNALARAHLEELLGGARPSAPPSPR